MNKILLNFLIALFYETELLVHIHSGNGFVAVHRIIGNFDAEPRCVNQDRSNSSGNLYACGLIKISNKICKRAYVELSFITVDPKSADEVYTVKNSLSYVDTADFTGRRKRRNFFYYLPLYLCPIAISSDLIRICVRSILADFRSKFNSYNVARLEAFDSDSLDRLRLRLLFAAVYGVYVIETVSTGSLDCDHSRLDGSVCVELILELESRGLELIVVLEFNGSAYARRESSRVTDRLYSYDVAVVNCNFESSGCKYFTAFTVNGNNILRSIIYFIPFSLTGLASFVSRESNARSIKSGYFRLGLICAHSESNESLGIDARTRIIGAEQYRNKRIYKFAHIRNQSLKEIRTQDILNVCGNKNISILERSGIISNSNDGTVHRTHLSCAIPTIVSIFMRMLYVKEELAVILREKLGSVETAVCHSASEHTEYVDISANLVSHLTHSCANLVIEIEIAEEREVKRSVLDIFFISFRRSGELRSYVIADLSVGKLERDISHIGRNYYVARNEVSVLIYNCYHLGLDTADEVADSVSSRNSETFENSADKDLESAESAGNGVLFACLNVLNGSLTYAVLIGLAAEKHTYYERYESIHSLNDCVSAGKSAAAYHSSESETGKSSLNVARGEIEEFIVCGKREYLFVTGVIRAFFSYSYKSLIVICGLRIENTLNVDSVIVVLRRYSDRIVETELIFYVKLVKRLVHCIGNDLSRISRYDLLTAATSGKTYDETADQHDRY